jgi:tetratricopeptide (TPR) repeat protein
VLRIWTFLILLHLSLPSWGNAHFDFSHQAGDVYNHILHLRFNDAKTGISEIKIDDPENMVVHLLENYIDFFSLFINEDPEQYNKLKDNKKKRLSALKKLDKTSPWSNYCQSEILLQWALIQLKFQDIYSSALDIRKAYMMLEENVETYPSFIHSLKSLSIIHALVGTIPDQYQWVVKYLGGMSGSLVQGEKEITDVLHYAESNPYLFEVEARAIHAFMQLHLNHNPEKAWDIIQKLEISPTDSPLATFAIANIALRTGKNDKAIDILMNRPREANQYSFPFLDHMLGLAKLQRLDTDADTFFLKFLKEYPGQNYIKETWYRLAWYSLLHGHSTKYPFYLEQCISEGAAVIDEDKYALTEAQKQPEYEVDLIAARLLFDGGYYEKAQLRLEKADHLYYNPRTELEYSYRLGRIFHEQDNFQKAEKFYISAIKSGESLSAYYACSAAYHLGTLYETEGHPQLAISSYNHCLKMHPESYKNSLHQKAKAGLQRLSLKL